MGLIDAKMRNKSICWYLERTFFVKKRLFLQFFRVIVAFLWLITQFFLSLRRILYTICKY